jgi:hypothetical protein
MVLIFYFDDALFEVDTAQPGLGPRVFFIGRTAPPRPPPTPPARRFLGAQTAYEARLRLRWEDRKRGS